MRIIGTICLTMAAISIVMAVRDRQDGDRRSAGILLASSCLFALIGAGMIAAA